MSQQLVALDFITRCLGTDRGLETTGTLRSDIVSGRISWETVVGLVNDHWIGPALWVALRDKALLDSLPGDLHEYLQALYYLNGRRNDGLRKQLVEVIHQLHSVGIEPVILKGAANLLTDIYNDQAVRVMTDLDILVSEQETALCMEALQGLGYRSCLSQEKYLEHHHHAPLFRSGDWGTLEVHRDLMFRTARHMLPTEMVWAHTQPLVIDGAKAKILSPTYRMLHNILHSQVVNRKYALGLIDLRSLQDMVSISDAYGSVINWVVIRKLMDRHGQGRMLRTYIYLAHRLLGMGIPNGLHPRVSSMIYYVRVRARIKWLWVRAWDRKIQRFSAYHILRRYSYENSSVSLTIGRLRYSGYLLSKYSRKALPKRR